MIRITTIISTTTVITLITITIVHYMTYYYQGLLGPPC